jgi:hypothetical protein
MTMIIDEVAISHANDGNNNFCQIPQACQYQCEKFFVFPYADGNSLTAKRIQSKASKIHITKMHEVTAMNKQN